MWLSGSGPRFDLQQSWGQALMKLSPRFLRPYCVEFWNLILKIQIFWELGEHLPHMREDLGPIPSSSNNKNLGHSQTV